MSSRRKWHREDHVDPELRDRLLYDSWPRPLSLPDWIQSACRPRLDALSAWLRSDETSFKNRASDPESFYGPGVTLHWVRDERRDRYSNGVHLLVSDPSPCFVPNANAVPVPQSVRCGRGHVSYHDLDPYPTIENVDAPAMLLEQEIAALQQLKVDVPILADILRWQREGLLKHFYLRGSRGGGFLLWKHVRHLESNPPIYRGNLGYPYSIGEQFKTGRRVGIGRAGMATAGPFGALRDWQLAKPGPHMIIFDDTIDAMRYVMSVLPKPDPPKIFNGPYVMAIWCTRIAHHPRDGVFYCLEGVPIAAYRATKLNEDEWRLDLDAGDDILRTST